MDDEKKNKNVKKVICDFCDEVQVVIPEDVQVGDVVECENCVAEYEVISVDPLKLRLVLEEK